MSYWQDRAAQSQAALSAKNQKAVARQLKKYYRDTAVKVIEDFSNTLDRVKEGLAEGIEPTPADLYKLDKYWAAQAQMRQELQKLGEKSIVALTKCFEHNFFDIYYSIALESERSFNTLDTAAVEQMISQIWCADGQSWSNRIWKNTELLAETLNEELIHTVVAGKSTNELKGLLMERFNVSYSRADSVVRTELAHIQTQAAAKRYEDAGIKQVQVWADKDERRCDVCGKLHKKIYPIGAAMPVPAHPRCRCCIIPVVEV
jgi:SPP1 gp7 family putative phage head morphogenesis protein